MILTHLKAALSVYLQVMCHSYCKGDRPLWFHVEEDNDHCSHANLLSAEPQHRASSVIQATMKSGNHPCFAGRRIALRFLRPSADARKTPPSITSLLASWRISLFALVGGYGYAYSTQDEARDLPPLHFHQGGNEMSTVMMARPPLASSLTYLLDLIFHG